MQTRIVKISGDREKDDRIIEEAGRIIKEGGLVAVPTETVYGLAGDALNPGSSKKIYEAKGRPSDNPLIVHIARLKDLETIARDIPDTAYALAIAYWPGPLTMVLNKKDIVPKETTGGLDTVAVRFPENEIMQKVIISSGGFIAAPSANRSGRPSCTNASHCKEDLGGRIDMIIDGGESGIGLESTVLDLTAARPVILRHGYIDKAMVERVTGPVDIETTATEKPRAPGMKYRHYAPKGELTLVSGEAEKTARRIMELAAGHAHNGGKTAVIFARENAALYEGAQDISLYDAGSLNDEDTIAHRLFSILRELDDEECRYIYSECFDTPRLGRAIMDRLSRAAEGRVINAD